MFTLQRPAEALNDYFWVQIAPDSPCTDFPCWGWQFTVQITGFNWCTQSPDSMLVNYGDCGPYFAYNFCWDESAGWNVSPLTPPPAGWYWAGVGADQYGRPLLYVSCAPPPPGPYTKRCDRKQGGDQHGGCASCGMARYSAHAMLASLNIEDTPIGYAPPRGPAMDFTVTYNQRETQQPQSFTYSNLGPKWTFNWLSYVVDVPNNPFANAAVYLPGGGAEAYSGFDYGTQSYLPDPQSHAILVRTSPTSYEKRFPDGSKQVFTRSDGATSYPRKIFMTQVVDPAGNRVTIDYDASLRITTLTDALGQPTTITHLSDDPQVLPDYYLIWKVTESFSTGRCATFTYTNGQLTTITDEIGIQSQLHYQSGTDFIDWIMTPYGTTNFATGGSGTNLWLEMTDVVGTERVEFRDNAPGISDTEAVAPAGMTNSGLAVANTFYWDKKAMAEAPGDYTKARIIHWAYNPSGSVTGIAASEKAPDRKSVV